MDAKARTEQFVVRQDLPIDVLLPNEENPNKMSARQFDLLVDNIERTGITDPILVRPVAGDKYRVVGGHHRLEAASYLDFEKVPCTIITDPDFDEEAEQFQMVRMNVIHGAMDPQKFMNLYNKVSAKYEQDVLQEMFGFADEALFKSLIKETKDSLPKDMQKEFDEATKEVKTIEELAGVLNHMLANFGDTLEYGYMIVDFGGKESVWLRMHKKDRVNFDKLASNCKSAGVTVDDLFRHMMLAAADEKYVGYSLISGSDIPDVVLTPTEEEIAKEL